MPVTYLDLDNENDVDQRIDNFLMRVMKGVPRQHVYKILRSGEVRVNGGRVRANYRLCLGDRVRVPPVRTRQQVPPRPAPGLTQRLTERIIYEDDHLLVIDKPAGMAVHGGSSVSSGVVEVLRQSTGNPDLGLVHRLDRATSGCLALAKDRKTLRELQGAFRVRQVRKLYLLYVWGAWPERLKQVQLRLLRQTSKNGDRRVIASQEGQTARTDFELLDHATFGGIEDRAAQPSEQRSAGSIPEGVNSISMLKASLHTGRTHQIRVHASANGYPLVGDDKYPGPHARPGRKSAHKTEEGARLCLHASRLMLPYAGTQLKLEAAEPPEMIEIWRQLTGRAPARA